MKTYPTVWQKKILWSALTGLALFFLGTLSVSLIWGAGKTLGFLQPLLIPVAIAGILAYLLNPLVNLLERRGVRRMPAVIYVFAIVLLPLTLISVWVIPEVYQQSVDFAKDLPGYVFNAKTWGLGLLERYQQRYADNPYVQQGVQQATDWIQHQLPELPPKIWAFLTNGLQGFLGVFGFLLGLIVVPVYLFFFLLNAGQISRRWGEYLPLRASPFKDEVIDCLTEINSYLIAFFRGQILVTTIDGAMLAVVLLVMKLKFAIIIGLLVAVLQLIPYLGVIICWIPAVLIAAAQWKDWQHPLWVTIAFAIVTHLDGLFIAPRIVGESVGLHPVTIIISVFGWSLLIGGPLGALMAVPLTATLKVLLKRYVWQKQFKPREIVLPVIPEVPSETPS